MVIHHVLHCQLYSYLKLCELYHIPNNLILLITNLGVIDVYDFKTCQSMLWEQSHVTAGHRKLFSMDLGYAGILSRQKSIETGVFSYNQLQRVNEYSLLETCSHVKRIHLLKIFHWTCVKIDANKEVKIRNLSLKNTDKTNKIAI